jgi:CheY-like chemotaxis protein
VTCADDDGTLGVVLRQRRWGLVLIDTESLESAGPDIDALVRKGVPVVELTLTIESAPAGTSTLLPTLARPLRRPTAAAVLAAALSRDVEVREDLSSAAPLSVVARVPRVLAVDDNDLNLRVVRELLEGRGCAVVIARTGREAVEAWHRERFDLVLMDVQMPELDGLQACEEIRQVEARRRVRRRTPIVAVTAHAMAGDRERCLAAGMDDYLPKPVRRATLYEMMDRLGIETTTPLDKPA